jgi:hypothetical protein
MSGILNGFLFENELFNKLNENELIIKRECDIRKEYFSYCIGVDIMIIDDNITIYI